MMDKERRGRSEQMAEWLVEEVHGTDLGGPEYIRHWIIEAETPQLAMYLAGEQSSAAGGGEFYFASGELRECISGYLWSAADGSMVAYDVRKLERGH